MLLRPLAKLCNLCLCKPRTTPICNAEVMSWRQEMASPQSPAPSVCGVCRATAMQMCLQRWSA